VDLATTAAVGLEGALGHGVCPVSILECLLGLVRVCEAPICPAQDPEVAVKANSTASLEYIRLEENRQRNIARGASGDVTDPVTESSSPILHNGWCNSKKESHFG
jgi:hypothetical protein